MGRHPKPDSMKILQGTDQPCRMNNLQPEYRLELSAEPPDHLTAMEQKIWREIIPQLIESKVYTTIDMTACIVLVQELATYYELQEATRGKLYFKAGNKIKANNDAYKLKTLQQMAWNNASKLMAQYGLTPVARQKLKITGPDGVEGMKINKALPPKPDIE